MSFRRRAVVLFSLSFLDCICCGFGAIILLFVLTIGSQTENIRDTREELLKVVQQQLAQLAEYRSSKDELLRTMSSRGSIVDETKKLENLKGLIADLERQIQSQKAGKESLLVDIDKAKDELAARQKKPEVVLRDVKPQPVGVPVGSNYLAFVIDTSGSMRDFSTDQLWPIVIRKVDEVLDAYPAVEGIQVLDADGRFIMGERGGAQWMNDSPEVREGIKRALRRYSIFSESNPVPGILRALRTLHDPKNEKMKMGIYIFGDEFSGTADAILNAVDRLNPADDQGNRPVVINAVTFPTTIRMDFSMGNTGLKMANLMRELCYQHGGAFIALQDL
jgi:competence protein ComGC